MAKTKNKIASKSCIKYNIILIVEHPYASRCHASDDVRAVAAGLWRKSHMRSSLQTRELEKWHNIMSRTDGH